MPTKETCDNCRFGFPHGGPWGHDESYKQCRNTAPTTKDGNPVYPVLPNDHWCGAWERSTKEPIAAKRYCKECKKEITDCVVITKGKSPWNQEYTCLKCYKKEKKR